MYFGISANERTPCCKLYLFVRSGVYTVHYRRQKGILAARWCIIREWKLHLGCNPLERWLIRMGMVSADIRMFISPLNSSLYYYSVHIKLCLSFIAFTGYIIIEKCTCCWFISYSCCYWCCHITPFFANNKCNRLSVLLYCRLSRKNITFVSYLYYPWQSKSIKIFPVFLIIHICINNDNHNKNTKESKQ